MLLELAGRTLVCMNQIRKDSFCKKIGGDMQVFSTELISGFRSGLDILPKILTRETARLYVSEYAPPFEANATFGRSMGSEH